MIRRETPELVPVLSRGKHRNPRKGACFMEYASFLAGERWSDHPECTHPLLAGVARDINDHISDDGRSRLVPLIPSVVGLNGDDPRIDIAIAMRCATAAVPVAAEFRQRALAAGLVASRHVLGHLDEVTESSFDSTALLDDVGVALRRAPHAARWAMDFVSEAPIATKSFRRRSAPNIVRVSITGIAEACIPDRDSLLHELLEFVIDDCRRWMDVSIQTEPDLDLIRV